MTHTYIKQRPLIQWKQEKATSNIIGWLALIVMVFSSSTYNAYAKVLTDVLSPLSLVFVSEVLTAFFLLVSFGAVPTLQKLRHVTREMVVPLMLIGVISGVCAPLLWFLGLHYTTAVNASLFGNAEMVFLTLFAFIVMREPFMRLHLFSILTIIAGILVIVFRGFTEPFIFRMGDLLLILSCFAYATGSSIFSKYLHRSDPQIVMLVRSATAITAFIVIAPLIGHPIFTEVQSFPLQFLPALIGFGFLSRFLNVFSFYEALEILPISTVSLSLNFSVIGSIIFAAWYLGESLTMYHIIGGVFILAGGLALEIIGIHPTEKHLEDHLTQGTARRK